VPRTTHRGRRGRPALTVRAPVPVLACAVALAAGGLAAGCSGGPSKVGHAGPTPSGATASAARAGTAPQTTPTNQTPTLPDWLAGAVANQGVELDPSWDKTMTVITDSVVLGARSYLPARVRGWKVQFQGFPALTLPAANTELRAANRPVGSVVVLALGYNSNWQRNRQMYDFFAKQFDENADRLIDTVKALGVKKIVWVNLRHATLANSPNGPTTVKEVDEYSWYFPYVNERLNELVKRHPDVALANWEAVSNRPGLTYDYIHLNPLGSNLMSEVIKASAGILNTPVPGL